MGAPIQPDEPVIVYRVRELIERLEEKVGHRLDEIAAKLDDRVTVGVFRALSSELDATKRRLAAVEEDITRRESAEQAGRRISDRALAWAGLIVATVAASATVGYLIEVMTHHG